MPDEEVERDREYYVKLGLPAEKYVGKVEFDREKGVTAANSMIKLAEVGWDIMALEARKKATSSGIVMGEFAHRLAVKFNRTDDN